MSYEYKNLVLSGESNGKKVYGSVKLEKFSDEEIIASLKCASNIFENDELLLGVDVDGNMKKVKLKKDNVFGYKFTLSSPSFMNAKISCVLLEKKNGNYETVLMGSTTITDNMKLYNFLSKTEEKETDDVLVENMNVEDPEKLQDLETESSDDEYITEETLNSIDELIDKYEDEKIEGSAKNFSEEESYDIFKESDSDLYFYSKIENQVNKMLEVYPKEDAISEILPNSKFVKVENVDEANHIFGVIYDEENIKPKYIVYGVPAKYGEEVSSTISERASWMPSNINEPKEYGYYLMYQDAETGKIVR